MSNNIRVKYRTWHTGKPPRPVKLQIPGWAGKDHTHSNGSEAQPWHCQPFVEGSTYGLELVYPFETECHVYMKDGKVFFDGDFTEESKKIKDATVVFPPFGSFADGHFGMTSCLDIQVPEDMILRLEPHPRFYTDLTYTCPLLVCGHLQTSWWPKIFFVVFKNPAEGQKYIFKQGEPYGQVLILPKKITYDVKEMEPAEKFSRGMQDKIIGDHAREIAGNKWISDRGDKFDDKYKKLSTLATKHGCPYVGQFLEKEKSEVKRKIKRKLIKKNENKTIQTKKNKS